MNPQSDDRQLGEYRLRQALRENEDCRLWLAEQTSVSRAVLVVEFIGGDDRHDAFLADVRAKAAVDHPLIGSVYEAVDRPGLCFFAQERLAGVTLADSATAGDTFPPARLAHILRRLAEANLALENLGLATSPLFPDAISIDEHGVTRIENLAISGPREPSQSLRDIVSLGTSLAPLVATDGTGATRLLTLLGWMRGEELQSPLTWTQTRDYALQIEHQLADPLSHAAASDPRGKRKKFPVELVVLGTFAVLAGIAALALKARPPAVAPRLPMPADVAIAAGTHPTPDGLEQPLPAFDIAATEVTIRQYAEFLGALDILRENHRETAFDAPLQPAEKTSHQPDDWPALLASARSQGVWKNLAVTLDCPVVGVDWWDASAYARWKQARLPTQEEWHAALTAGGGDPAALPAAPWASVTAPTADRTANGLLGMAGSVSEWTANPAPNPANPLGEKLWVIIGGSHLKPGTNALSREWTADRALRRPDLGFRVVPVQR